MAFDSLLILGNLAAGETLLIDEDGNIRVLGENESINSGDLVLSSSESEAPSLNVGLAGENDEIQDITSEIDDILAALESGQDPTELGDEFATAAGGQAGSSPSSISAIDRTGELRSPGTNFETEGIFNDLGLSTTQSLALIEQFQAFQQSPVLTDINNDPIADDLAFITNEDTSVGGQVFATDPNPNDILSFSVTTQPDNGEVVLNPVSGVWEYTPDTNYDGLDLFAITVDDSNGGTDVVSVNVEVIPIPEVTLSGVTEVTEGANADYVIEFDKPSTQVTNINLSISTSTAELDDLSTLTVTTPDGESLIVGVDGTIEVPVGVTSLNVSVGTVDDDVFEGNEDFQLNLTSGFGTVGGGEQASTIQDNDTPVLSVGSDSVVEGDTAVFDVALSNEVDGEVTYT
ncbi:hypothetical protein F0225_10555, partial [Vibrio pectenicida]